MGMYTRLTFWAEVKPDCEALPILRYLADPSEEAEPTGWPDHEFFRTDRFTSTLVCSSYYHQTKGTVFAYDDISKTWMLNVDSSLKNYGDEIGKFLDWFSPYDAGYSEFRGFYLYEESEDPTLIYRVGSGSEGRYDFAGVMR